MSIGGSTKTPPHVAQKHRKGGGLAAKGLGAPPTGDGAGASVPVQNGWGSSILELEGPYGATGGACGEDVPVDMGTCVGFATGEECCAAGRDVVATTVIEGDEGAVLDFG